jgi:hypothetical protein
MLARVYRDLPILLDASSLSLGEAFEQALATSAQLFL